MKSTGLCPVEKYFLNTKIGLGRPEAIAIFFLFSTFVSAMYDIIKKILYINYTCKKKILSA